MASKGNQDMTQTVLATRQSIVTYMKESIQPKIKEWEKEIKSFREKKNKIKEEEQFKILFDMLSRMTDQVTKIQISIGFRLYEVKVEKEKSQSVSEDMEIKLAEWKKLSKKTEKQDQLERLLNIFLTQLQFWTEKLQNVDSRRQHTPQKMDPRVQNQHNPSDGTAGTAQTTQGRENKNLQEQNKKLEKEVSDLQIKYDLKVAEQLEKNQEGDNLKAEIERLKKKISEQSKEVRAKEMGNDEPLKRHTITDLCSEVRPIKISEQFKEIYDNQWADAFEELKDQGYPEVTAIQILITTVDDSFQFTADMAKRRLDHLETSTQTSVLNTTQKIQEPAALSEECADLVKQLRRASVQIHVEKIQKGFIETQIPKHPPEKKEAIIHFYKECARVTWYMNVQTPPLSLPPKPARGTDLDTDMYSMFTQTGTTVEYMVWPACLLHEDGPVLSKGVIQPLKQENMSRAQIALRKDSKNK